jgi:hypothetical protein
VRFVCALLMGYPLCRPKHWMSTSPPRPKNPRGVRTAREPLIRAKRKVDLVATASYEARKANGSSIQQTCTAFDAHSLCKRRAQAVPMLTTSTASRSARLSFAPTFVATKDDEMEQSCTDDVMCSEDSVNLSESNQVVTPNPITRLARAWQPPLGARSQAPTSPVQGRKTKSALGPLAKRLQSIRQRIDGDAIRLSSGQYPFRLKPDGNDPRNRADTFCDVTILGSPVPWEAHSNLQQAQLLVVRGYIHSWTVVSAAAPSTIAPSQDFAWIVLSNRIACEHSLAEGSQIRVYDATFVAWQARTNSIGSADNAMDLAGDQVNHEKNSSMQKVLLCSNLCEVYHSSLLPPLSPDVSTLLQLNAAN